MSWELVKHSKTASGWFYVGHAEEAVFDVTLPPEQIPGMSWFADRVVDALIEAAKGEGEVLEAKVYYDPSSWLDCKYRVVVTGHGSPLAWTPIIIAALAVIGLAIIAWILHSVEDVKWFGAAAIGFGVGAAALGVGFLIKNIRTKGGQTGKKING